MKRPARFPVSTTLLRRLAFANIVANAAIVVTGGAVRLTASGLGCPTWPRCTDESYTATAEMGLHGMIEFGNRLLSFVLVLIAGATLLAALAHRPRRRGVVPLALAVVLGIVAQAVIGGITVRTQLHPSIVGIHFVVSMLLLLVAYALWRRVGEPDGRKVPLVPSALRALTWVTVVASVAVIIVGVAVTGSGPHAGDADAVRNGLDPQTISQIHADLVFLLVGLTVGLWLALRAVGAPAHTVRAALTLLLVELGQGVIGFVQYFTNLPALLVGIHMLGSCLVWLATLAVLWSIRERRPAEASPAGAAAPAEARTASLTV
ncbi:cytochrome c oxidase assembly protein subunit 15 [Micromonospora phaseoli]|uniref:Cytochrome c oxidase assembly protein subunit 15 n=1 Tax=Micromonospora phaseoli TaxID=1144548 RepID=A0A1H7DA14_9ACTN|nr:cytochrome c oxidase assembly protein subunit 15 [Micromonospora phaseoli]GIJ77487.1 cytochrome b561 [Micromonospora phaseoli]SEJ97707.1 cytochrome c oxidase assembly protein subunit 15 [Micromonospora phaseoli]